MSPSQRLLHDLAQERTKLRIEMALTAVTGVGLVLALTANRVAGEQAGPALATVGFVIAYLVCAGCAVIVFVSAFALTSGRKACAVTA